jgi:hypothetical protein
MVRHAPLLQRHGRHVGAFVCGARAGRRRQARSAPPQGDDRQPGRDGQRLGSRRAPRRRLRVGARDDVGLAGGAARDEGPRRARAPRAGEGGDLVRALAPSHRTEPPRHRPGVRAVLPRRMDARRLRPVLAEDFAQLGPVLYADCRCPHAAPGRMVRHLPARDDRQLPRAPERQARPRAPGRRSVGARGQRAHLRRRRRLRGALGHSGVRRRVSPALVRPLPQGSA